MIQQSRKLALISAIALLVVGACFLIRYSNLKAYSERNSEKIILTQAETYNAPDEAFFENPKDVEKEIIVPKYVDPLSRVTSRAYLIGDIETGKIYLNKNSDVQLPVASMSKLVTAIIATKTLKEDTMIQISSSTQMIPPDSSGVRVGEQFSLKEILYPMLLNSSNIAAEAIASTSGRINFLELMSSLSWEIGMPQAYFADPSGVDPHNQASSKDIFALAQYLYKSRPDILEITRTKSISVASTTDHDAHDFMSIHPFINDERFIGGKTGRTKEAGETMLTILNIDGKATVFVIMGSNIGMRAIDTKILIDEYLKM